MVPTVSMFEATMGTPFQVASLFRNRYSRRRTMLARLGASERLGRISTSSKSSLGSLSMRMTGQLPCGCGVRVAMGFHSSNDRLAGLEQAGGQSFLPGQEVRREKARLVAV